MMRQEFINKAWEAAVEARQNGAALSVPVVVAQAALETNFGQSELTKYNNLFGIKGTYKGEYVEFPTKEQNADGSWKTVYAKFRKYPDWKACFEDYGSIIARLSWYQDAEDAAHEPKDFLKGLLTIRSANGQVLEPGWATDLRYYEKVWGIVENYNLLDRQEIPAMDEFELVQIYDSGVRLDLEPVKHTIGTTKGGGTKLMIRVKPTTFMQRLNYLLGR